MTFSLINLSFISPSFSLLKGRSFPGKVLLTRKSEPPNVHASRAHTQEMERSYSQNDPGNEHTGSSFEVIVNIAYGCSRRTYFFIVPSR